MSDRGNYHEASWRASNASGQANLGKTALQLRGVNVDRFSNNATLIKMTEPIDLPPELQHVADLLSDQPPEVRELFRYALVLAMSDDERARITGTLTGA